MIDQDPSTRLPLTKERILQAAVALADRQGLAALTMRRLGSELGVEAMSLYKHIANKDEILEGMVEAVIGEIEIPKDGADWKAAMRQRAFSAREILSRHSWAIVLFESRASTGPSALRYIDSILGNLMSAGFSIENAGHAFWLLDCYVYGQVIQETNIAYTSTEEIADTPAATLDQATTDEYPNLGAMYQHIPESGYSIDSEFEFGLDLILDGLERHRSA